MSAFFVTCVICFTVYWVVDRICECVLAIVEHEAPKDDVINNELYAPTGTRTVVLHHDGRVEFVPKGLE